MFAIGGRAGDSTLDVIGRTSFLRRIVPLYALTRFCAGCYSGDVSSANDAAALIDTVIWIGGKSWRASVKSHGATY